MLITSGRSLGCLTVEPVAMREDVDWRILLKGAAKTAWASESESESEVGAED